MKRAITIFLLIFISYNKSNAQNRWTYKNGDSNFDGKYKTSSIIGKGESPYNNPMFVINMFEGSNEPNMYFTNAGYSGCSDKIISLKFDADDNIYKFYASADNDRESWFLGSKYHTGNTITTPELIEKLKVNSKFYVRLESNCGQKDLVFSLSGSSKAINFVLKDYISKKALELKQDSILKKQENDSINDVILKEVRIIMEKLGDTTLIPFISEKRWRMPLFEDSIRGLNYCLIDYSSILLIDPQKSSTKFHYVFFANKTDNIECSQGYIEKDRYYLREIILSR